MRRPPAVEPKSPSLGIMYFKEFVAPAGRPSRQVLSRLWNRMVELDYEFTVETLSNTGESADNSSLIRLPFLIISGGYTNLNPDAPGSIDPNKISRDENPIALDIFAPVVDNGLIAKPGEAGNTTVYLAASMVDVHREASLTGQPPKVPR